MPVRGACEQRLRELEIVDKVQFISEQITVWNEMPTIYAEADVYLATASFSNGNLSMVEAMASGMGIIFTDRILGDAARLVREAGSDLLCAPNAAELTAAARRYHEEPELFRIHARRNRELANHFRPETTAQALRDLVGLMLRPQQSE